MYNFLNHFKMIKVGFLLKFTEDYKGGINYFKNLFHALNQYHSDDIEIILFVPDNLKALYNELFSPYAKIISTKILQRNTLSWAMSRVCDKYFGFDPMVYFLLRKHRVNCVSHSNYVYPFSDIKTINWVPDFQYLHYPNLWKPNQLKDVYKVHKNWIDKSDMIVVSSYAAKNDLLSLYPEHKNVEVLHFVSQPEDMKKDNSDLAIDKIFERKFFYLPNQFWLHKNHMVVFKAIKILKEKNLDIQLITTGSKNDYRDGGQHFTQLLNYVKENNLEENIIFLGIVPYSQVFFLMKNSVAIINPSHFEGWSSSVEESKSLDKIIVLSDIPVHREQNPLKGIYFAPDDENRLAEILDLLWKDKFHFNDNAVINSQQLSLEARTRDFSDRFYNIIIKLCNNQ